MQLELSLTTELPELPPAVKCRYQPEEFSRGHPSFYYWGGQPLSWEAIPPVERERQHSFYEFPTRQAHSWEAVARSIAEAKIELLVAAANYERLIRHGHRRFSAYDIGLNQGDHRRALAMGFSLVNNHISYYRGLLQFLNRRLCQIRLIFLALVWKSSSTSLPLAA